MKSILSQLYQGELSPCEQYRPRLVAHKKSARAQALRYESFRASLTPSCRADFDAILDDYCDKASFELEETFTDAFRLGARFILEILQAESGSCSTH